LFAVFNLSRMSNTKVQRLEAVRTAIDELIAVMSSTNAVQEYSVQGRMVKRADFASTLETLQKTETKLEQAIASANRKRFLLAKKGRRV